MIQLKRVYSEADENDGTRVLVDRLWPRGVSRESAHIDIWLKEIAPSSSLRKWFNHDTEKWDEFKTKYTKELVSNPKLEELKNIVSENNKITLLFAARDEEHNNALVIKQQLENNVQN